MTLLDLKQLGLPEMPAHLAEVERAMLGTLKSAPAELAAPARRVTQAGGKRLRPALVLAAAASTGKPVTPNAIQVAAAIELVHTGTLVHDDIMDAADTRRGQPTISAQEGNDVALLAGDYLLAQAGVLAAGVSAEAALLINTTIAELCAGQSRELSSLYDTGRTPASYRQAIRGKTAALLAAACRIGGLTAGLRGRRLDALAAYGLAFGMAFQIADDLHDLDSDMATGVYNLPVLLGLRGSSADQIRPMLGRRPASRLDTARVVEFLSHNGYLAAAITEATRYAHQAEAALAVFETTPVIAGLAALPSTWTSASLQDLNINATRKSN